MKSAAELDTTNTGHCISFDALMRLQHQAKLLKLKNNKLLKTHWHGDRSSRLRGRGMEFEEVRHYLPGDDIRTMDWRVTARTGKPHTKVFQEERERAVMFYIDLGATMHFGTEKAFKSTIAAQIASLIAWSAIQAGDKVGGIVASHKHSKEFKPKSRSNSILPLLKFIADSCADHPQQIQTNPLNDYLLRLKRLSKPGNLIVIVSDFYSLNDDSERIIHALAKHNDIILCHIFDRLETTPPPKGQYQITNGDQRINFNTLNNKTRLQHKTLFQQRQARLQELTRKFSGYYCPITTKDNVTDILRHHLNYGGIKPDNKVAV